MRHQWTYPDLRRAWGRVAAGKCSYAVARDIGATYKSMSSALRRNGLPLKEAKELYNQRKQDRARRLVIGGMSVERAAKLTGVCPATLYRKCRDLDLGKNLGRHHSVDQERDRQVYLLRLGGMTARQVGEKLGLAERTVWKYSARYKKTIGADHK